MASGHLQSPVLELLNALSDLSVRAGRVLYIGIGAVGVKSFFLIEEATHDLLKETMTLKLKVV